MIRWETICISSKNCISGSVIHKLHVNIQIIKKDAVQASIIRQTGHPVVV